MPDGFWDVPIESPQGHGKTIPQTPALDFLRRVEVWQQAPGGTAGIAVIMPAGDIQTLHQLLDSFRQGQGGTWKLENQARTWLIGYREMEPPLTPSQRAQLDAVIAGLPEPPSRPARRLPRLHVSRRARIAWAFAIVILVLFITGLAAGVFSQPANPVQHGAQSQSQPQQVAPADTDLQNFESDWGPFRQLAASQQNPQTGAPALLLLNQGGYYASQDWTIPGRSSAWTADLGGNISGTTVEGNHALVMDSDGNLWVVGIRQPFVLATNPGTVLEIDPAGTPLSIPEAHALSPHVRTHL